MVEKNSPSQSVNGFPLRLIVIGSGILILILLMFADKTNLDNQEERLLDTGSSAMVTPSASSIPQGKLPPLAPDPQLDAWVADAEKNTGDTQKVLLDSIVNRLSARNRFDYAAIYASQSLAHDSSLNARLRVGRLYQQASRLEYIANDTVLFQQYSNQAINQLEKVVEQAPQNEEGLYYLGLAYVESKNPQYSMQGILTIRKILEINPDNVQATYSLGMFSIQTGQFDKALGRFEKVLQLQTENQSARYYLAYAKVQLNQPEGVSDLLETVLKEAKDPELKQLARNLMNQIN